MTHLVKFMSHSLALAQKALRARKVKNLTHKCSLQNISTNSHQRHLLVTTHFHEDYGHSNDRNQCNITILLGTSFAFLGFFEKKEEEENPLITTLKRSILLIQKGEFKKAEQMLHIALKQAQDLQNEDGITYVYDVMANLAFEVGEYEKAEKLFKAVMQRELAKGTSQNDMKIVHMSLKMAKILEQRRLYDNAELGYKYCLKILQEHIDHETEDLDIIALYAMNVDWYAHFLMTMSRYTEAMRFMEKAYDLCVKLNGEIHEQSVVLLNDLGSICFIKGNLDEAINFLSKAAEIGANLPDMEDLSSIHINLGNVYIKKGLLDEAKKCCTTGWRLSKSKKNLETLEEAKTCLDEVNKLLTK
ncbi:tetratricopeptide repeat protein 19 homolog, mitochondrial [Phymastichus coffea]|uniref:tetratricopeptide repeat protein 19 homolog, mitochondrial n=1 Tax=Phymastichus coffea TaxID=108790 RepID=UPI00273AFFCB|nr:tetratricopeptide repeat protein 19 homolog, mitochondrial [Phymastichus coffea]XP_058804759.1 tetratricopeptide repeat protein 19 homolog, mitochondrial [Phymastichus coffea]